ncbi:MAG: hypothetical protein L3J69_10895 [Desulfobacula sp.]|nr:hypothetical protein [Desulfobacula sp.]
MRADSFAGYLFVFLNRRKTSIMLAGTLIFLFPSGGRSLMIQVSCNTILVHQLLTGEIHNDNATGQDESALKM